MKTIVCPVCESTVLQNNICKNCGSNLSTILMLEELPEKEELIIPSNELSRWLVIGLAILILIVGIGFGAISIPFLVPKLSPISQELRLSNGQHRTQIPFPQATSNQSKEKDCGGFHYTVQKGDSLSLIAKRFYGEQNLFSLIIKANPNLNGREDYLDIGQKLFVPNRKEQC